MLASLNMTQASKKWLLLATAFLTFQSAFAQLEDTGAPAPWNKRFARCSHPFLVSFECPGDPWQNATSSLQHLRSEASRGDFAALEADLRRLSDSVELFPDRLYKSSVVYLWIKEVVANERDPNQPQVVREVLARWHAAVPDSQFVLLAEGLRLHGQAWAARGGGFAKTVSPQAWKLFSERLAAAEAKLLQVQPWLKQTPMWGELMLIVTQEGQGVRTDWRTVFAETAKRWPADLRIYTLVVYRLQPKWGGSWDKVEAFADAAAKNVQRTEGQSFYARVYSRLGDDQLVESRESIRWPKLKAAFADWLQRSPDEYTKNRYASFACFARDKVAYRDAMAHLAPSERYDAPWLEGYSLESCNLWASRP